MAKLLVLLGAGASKHTGTPLMEDFLDRVHDIGAHREDRFKTVIDLVADLEILHSRSVVNLRNIESVFNIVEMAKVVGRLPQRNQAAIHNAAITMRKVVSETLEQTCHFRMVNGVMSPSTGYDLFADFLSMRDKSGGQKSVALITFNYDVALDYALTRRDIAYHYGVPEQENTGIPLLKLHGSLS